MTLGKRPLGASALLYLFLLIVAVLYAYPLYYAATTALKTNEDALQMPPKFIFRPTLHSFAKAFRDYDLWPALANSVIVSFSNMALTLLIGCPAAFSLSRGSFRGRKVISFWILTSRMIPPIIMVIPFFLISRRFGLYDTRLLLVVVYLTINLAFVVWVMKSFFDDIPLSLDEAARIDGCSELSVFFRVILPLSVPGLVSTAIFCLMFTWNEFMYALSLTEYRAATLPITFSKFIGFSGIEWSSMSATAVVTMLPILVAASLVQKHIIKGMTLGSVK